MSDFRRVTESLSVSPQVTEADMTRAAPEGWPGSSPSGAAIEAAARAAGLDYLHVPVHGRPTQEQVDAVRAATQGAGGPVLAFCRSGTRSIVTWSIGQALAGEDRETLVNQGREAGYDLSGVLPS